MKSSEKYIMFSTNQKGKDGYKYVRRVKYKLIKETADAFYIAGNKNTKCESGNRNMNIFSKMRLKGKFTVGDIVLV